jgi:hypothetical protein
MILQSEHPFVLSDLLETSGLSQSPLAGHRRLRFSFFADEPVPGVGAGGNVIAAATNSAVR